MQRTYVDQIHSDLVSAVGEDRVANDPTTLISYGADHSVPSFLSPNIPDFVVLPKDVVEVKNVMEIASRHKIPVVPMSAGASTGGLTLPAQGGIILDLKWMNRIIEINTDAAYAVIEPGVTFGQLSAAVRRVGFKVQLPTTTTGMAPTANYLMKPSGNYATRHLDPVLGLEVVLPGGEIVKTGSAAWPGAGWYLRYGPFPDLTGIFCETYGTLAVVTKMALRIYPQNEEERLVLTAFDTFESTVEYIKTVVRANLAEHCHFWHWRFLYVNEIARPEIYDPPPQVWQESYSQPKGDPYGITLNMMSGYKEDLDCHEELCGRVAKEFGGRIISEDECKSKWLGSWNFWEKLYTKGIQPKPGHETAYGKFGLNLNWIIHAEPRRMIEIEKWAFNEVKKKGLKQPLFTYAMSFDFARSMFMRLYAFMDPTDKEYQRHVRGTFAEMYDLALKNYGAVPFKNRRDPSWVVKLGGYYYTLLRGIKKHLDPDNIMNPGVGLF